MKKNIVYSTNPDYVYVEEKDETVALEPKQQKLRLHLERLKGGKEATLVRGFVGTDADLEELGKFLKTRCGVGGSAKEGEIIVQGNHRDKVLALLIEKGYTQTKKAGG